MDGKGADDAMLKGQADLWRCIFGFADSKALKCAVDLGIADIIHSHGRPITLRQIAASIKGSLSPDIPSLERVMRLLVRRDIFAAHRESDSEDVLYGLTHLSTWLVTESEFNLVPMILFEDNPIMATPWNHFGDCIREGGTPFEKAHGANIWETAAKSPDFNKSFNEGMACSTKIITKAVLAAYKDGFGSIGSLVDVGGGMGVVISEIVKANPSIRGVNFDLPHVVATAPSYPAGTSAGTCSSLFRQPMPSL